jgi:methyl-accepting chemotaxis protein
VKKSYRILQQDGGCEIFYHRKALFMNNSNLDDIENMTTNNEHDLFRKEMKNFFWRFFLLTDGIAYILIIPVSAFIFYKALKIEEKYLYIVLGILTAGTILALVVSYITTRIVLKPLINCFKTAIDENTFSFAGRNKACKRSKNIPKIHSTILVIRWVVIMGAIIASVYIFGHPSLTDTVNMWSVFIVDCIIGGLLYYIIPENLLRRIALSGIFHIEGDEFKTTGSLGRYLSSVVTGIIIVTVIITLAVAHNMMNTKLRESALDDMSGPASHITSNIEKSTWEITSTMIIIVSIGLVVVGFLVRIIINLRVAPLEKTQRAIGRMADGNLTQELFVTTNDEIGTILDSVRKLTAKLNESIKNIKTISHELATSSEEIDSTTSSFTDNAQNQAASAEEITATVEEVSAGIDNISERAGDQDAHLVTLISVMEKLSEIINDMNQKISNSLTITGIIGIKAKDGEESLKSMNSTMIKITESSRQMMNVINIINEISEQINLLSLNASIEAARAGELGRGFAVVADEISKLADQTTSSINDIEKLIRDNDDEIRNGMQSVNSTIDVISSIIDGVTEISNMTKEIAEHMNKQVMTNSDVNTEANDVKNMSESIKISTNEQKRAVNEIVKSISSITELTQTNAAGSEELSSSTNRLITMADKLTDAMNYFKVKE